MLFDRSWYNRAGVERVLGFCTDADYEEFFHTAPSVTNVSFNLAMIGTSVSDYSGRGKMGDHAIHELHEKAAHHHEQAAKHHHEAAKHHKAGHHEKAAHHSTMAHGHHLHATDHHENASKKHAEDHG